MSNIFGVLSLVTIVACFIYSNPLKGRFLLGSGYDSSRKGSAKIFKPPEGLV